MFKKMGLLLNSTKPKKIADEIKFLLNNDNMIKEISKYNYNYAKQNFYASGVVKRIEKIYKYTLNR